MIRFIQKLPRPLLIPVSWVWANLYAFTLLATHLRGCLAVCRLRRRFGKAQYERIALDIRKITRLQGLAPRQVFHLLILADTISRELPGAKADAIGQLLLRNAIIRRKLDQCSAADLLTA